MKEKPKRDRVQVMVPREDHNALKAWAFHRGHTIQVAMALAIAKLTAKKKGAAA